MPPMCKSITCDVLRKLPPTGSSRSLRCTQETHPYTATLRPAHPCSAFSCTRVLSANPRMPLVHRRLTQVLEVEEEVAIIGPHPVACTEEVVAAFTGVPSVSKASVSQNQCCSLKIAQTWQW